MPGNIPTTRKRDIPTLDFKGSANVNVLLSSGSSSYSYPTQSGVCAVTRPGKQVTVSTGHPFQSRKGLYGDIGGDFYTTMSQIAFAPRDAHIRTTVTVDPSPPPTYRTTRYDGFLAAIDPSDASVYPFPPTEASSEEKMSSFGATAIARCKPTNSVADVSTAIGELFKDGLPSLIGHTFWKDKTSNIRKQSGGEFLNIQFGWLPLVSDVKKFANAIDKADTVLAQYERDSGKVVRRRYNFPRERDVKEEVVAQNVQPYMPVNTSDLYDILVGRVVRVRETTRVRWFSGAFTYHLPSGTDSRSAMTRYALEAKKLLGLTLTPETLWNLAPWSWATDWFFNTGDVISNLTDWKTDGLVMRYGYIMETVTVTDTYRHEPNNPSKDYPYVPVVKLVTTTKTRFRANPFGFGVIWSGLSPRQLAITAALGLSRS